MLAFLTNIVPNFFHIGLKIWANRSWFERGGKSLNGVSHSDQAPKRFLKKGGAVAFCTVKDNYHLSALLQSWLQALLTKSLAAVLPVMYVSAAREGRKVLSYINRCHGHLFR